MQKNDIFEKIRKLLFLGKKGQTNPGTFTRLATHVTDHTTDKGTYFLIIAFIIFLLDLSTTFFGFNLGPRYSGFQWVWGTDFINIITNIVTSSIFATFMVFFIIVKLARRNWQTLGIETISFGLFAVVMTFFIMNNNWIGFPKAFIHFFFIILFGFTFIRSHEDSSAAFIFITSLLLVDFFGYLIFSKLIVFRYIPFLFVFVIIYVYSKTQNAASIIFVILLISVMFVFSYKDVQAQGGEFSFIANRDGPTLEETRDSFIEGYRNIYAGWQTSIQKQIKFAITGKVEENQYEPLGVYLEDIRSAQSRYYTDESVVVWGNVRARTLDDPINIKLGCFAGDRDDNNFASKISPNKTFSVFTLEEQDFACSFEQNSFEPGSETITTFADFNFETLAFLKVYFMDRERLRAMTRENLDPFEEFGIQDKNPEAIYTNGPAEIGMETTSSLIGVSNSYLALPRFSVSIQNRQGWEGKITALKELILLFPKGVELSDPANDCINRKFEKYNSDACQKKSCEQFVKNECLSVCEGYKNPDGSITNEYRSCADTCDDELKQCQKECTFLFQEEGENFIGFALASEDIKEINIKLSEDDFFDDSLFFSCNINPMPSEVLGNTPITTKSFRVKARYDYSVESAVSVRIDKIPGLDEKAGGKVREITGTNEVHTKVIQLANQMSSPSNPVLVVAIAEKESSFNHCKNENEPCGTAKKDNVNCNSAGSCGVMQINKEAKAHPDLFEVGTIKLGRYKCNVGKTAYDLDCNIKSGIGILQDNFNIFGNDDKLYNNAVDANCNPNNNPELNQKYKDYTNAWDRALRAYNGFGCTEGADTNYVDGVNKLKKS